ncbi:MAG TPA: response regulator [Polyangiaceae bacterium]|nr:response regulator [Polyangiaceae bacterium]
MNTEHVILLVEDSESDEELTLRAFRKSNVSNRVVVMRDGAAALDYLFLRGTHANRNPLEVPQLVLLDLNLPKVGGLEVLAAMRADERTQRLPVVILTSSREERDLAEGYDLGANSYIVKPVDFVQFADAVRQLGLYWLVLNQGPPRRH